MAILGLFTGFMQDLLHTFFELLYAPLIFKEMLYILLPVMLAIILMEYYFTRYPRESIGHHKSLENAIFLVFISFDMVRYIFTTVPLNIAKVSLLFIFVIFAVVISVLDFFHRLPTTFVFRTSSKFSIAFISYLAVVLMYSDLLMPFTAAGFLAVLISILALFFILVGIRHIMILLEPKSYEEIEHFLKNIEDDIRKASQDREKSADDVMPPPLSVKPKPEVKLIAEKKKKSNKNHPR